MLFRSVGVPGPAGNGKDDDIRMFIGLEHGLHDGAHPATEVANTNRISSNSLCFMTRNILVYVY